ncbi:MAG TPA: DUF4190 domain-containing protein [Candidatus Nanoarchaeia archaeon]|nr:DUF4190 domain-containing protein [Candidatus Nanoarchaeia archaeon]
MVKEYKSATGFAITSLVLSLLGFFPVIPSLLGLIFGIIGLRRARNNPEQDTEKILSILGMVFSILGLLFWLVMFLVILWGAALFANSGITSTVLN